MNAPNRSRVARKFACVALLAMTLPGLRAQITDEKPPPARPALPDWPKHTARHLIGLPDVGENVEGVLVINAEGVTFTSLHAAAQIAAHDVISLSVGDERMMKGGRKGQFARKLPYGAGEVVGLATIGKVDLITVEFIDTRGAYHGAVFSVPRDSTTTLRNTTFQPRPSLPPQTTSCSAAGAVRNIIVAVDRDQDGKLPMEYTVLLYEHLIARLRDGPSAMRVERVSGQQAVRGCDTLVVTVRLESFRKGNASQRAMTGPVGMFVGVTSLKCHVTATDATGVNVFDEGISSSRRGDSESLAAADSIAKSLTKKLTKLSRTTPPQA